MKANRLWPAACCLFFFLTSCASMPPPVPVAEVETSVEGDIANVQELLSKYRDVKATKVFIVHQKKNEPRNMYLERIVYTYQQRLGQKYQVFPVFEPNVGFGESLFGASGMSKGVQWGYIAAIKKWLTENESFIVVCYGEEGAAYMVDALYMIRSEGLPYVAEMCVTFGTKKSKATNARYTYDF